MPSQFWKVGELAQQTGVSVRTLHHYDAIGLLVPTNHTESGYRLYSEQDVIRLQQIKSLRLLGFSLAEIQTTLDSAEFTPKRIIQLHLDRLNEQITVQQRLRDRLEKMVAHLGTTQNIAIDQFIQTIEAITMFEKYYTPEQLNELSQRQQQLGEAGMNQVQQEWIDLIAQVKAEMAKGSDPTSKPVQHLAKQWKSLINEFTGGNPEMAKSLNKMYQEEGVEVASRGAIDTQLSKYIGQAMAALNSQDSVL
jgi:MerR family transcriptional regulator, thiopeptide resistance regulator